MSVGRAGLSRFRTADGRRRAHHAHIPCVGRRSFAGCASRDPEYDGANREEGLERAKSLFEEMFEK
jgi:hypothetical protein